MSQGPKPPFQFTLRQLMTAMAGACVLAATCYWLGVGPAMFTVAFFGFLACTAYLVSRRRYQEAVVAAICGMVLTCLLSPAIQGARETPRWAFCQYNLHNIVLALQQYEVKYGTFPPAYVADADGKPMHSWRVLILPFLDQRNFYNVYSFDEPWDGPNNSQWHNERLKVFECPSDRHGWTDTSYVAVTGSQTLWPGAKSAKMADIKDGAGNTILLVEVHNSGIHWMEPRDLEMSQMDMAVNSPSGPSISSGHLGGFAHVAFADGKVQAIDTKASAKAIRAALTIAGGEKEKLPVKRLPR